MSGAMPVCWRPRRASVQQPVQQAADDIAAIDRRKNHKKIARRRIRRTEAELDDLAGAKRRAEMGGVDKSSVSVTRAGYRS